MTRPNKLEWYFELARVVAKRSPCGITRRGFGAILVKNDAIISTGYAGSVRGVINCGDKSPCLKDLYQEEPNKSYDHCCSVHAEQNAIVNAAREGVSTVGATLYLAEVNDRNDRPCFLCRRFIIQAGIKDVYYYKKRTDTKMHKIGFLSWSNVVYDVYHEEVSDWISLDNDWINEQIKNAPKSN